jgi:parvulin-like peptidyl-prolyl isomerase
MADALKAGASYEDLAAKAVADKKVKGVEEGGFINPGALEPHIRETIATMGTGSVSPVIRVQSAKTTGFTIIKLEDKRYPKNPAVREQAERSVLAESRKDRQRAGF